MFGGRSLTKLFRYYREDFLPFTSVNSQKSKRLKRILWDSWNAFFTTRPEDDDGARNTKAYTDSLDDVDEYKRIKAMTEDPDTVPRAADTEQRIQILHPPYPKQYF